MCGLVGAVGSINPAVEKVFKELLYLDVVRGPHSTGIINVTPEGTAETVKGAMSPYELLCSALGTKVMGYKSVGLMGHNRYATVGKITTQNAHPFCSGNITGMHNGTLRNWRVALDDSDQFDVDSECLIHNINKNGIEKTLAVVDGAFALTYYDEESHTINLVRNNERPLYTWATEFGGTTFWASEEWMLEVACERNGLRMDKAGPQGVPTEELLTFDAPKVEFGVAKKPLRKSLDFYQPPVYTSQYHGGNQYGTTTGKSPDQQLTDMRKLIGQRVTFYPTDLIEGDHDGKMFFIEGCMSQFPSYDTRFRCNQQEAYDWAGYMDVDVTGVVSSVSAGYIQTYKGRTSVHSAFLSIDPKTVKIATQADILQLYPDQAKKDKLVKGPKGNVITEAEHNKLTKDGCVNCTTNIFYGDDVVWMEPEGCMCTACAEEIAKETISMAGA